MAGSVQVPKDPGADSPRVSAADLETGMVVRRRGKLLAILRATPVKGRVHVYTEEGVDFEPGLGDLVDHPSYPCSFVRQFDGGPAAQDWVDEVTGRSDRRAARQERRTEARKRAEQFTPEQRQRAADRRKLKAAIRRADRRARDGKGRT